MACGALALAAAACLRATGARLRSVVKPGLADTLDRVKGAALQSVDVYWCVHKRLPRDWVREMFGAPGSRVRRPARLTRRRVPRADA